MDGPLQPLLPEDPRKVGGNRLAARIGAGGMGRIYLGTAPSGQRVAVKVIRPEFADEPEFQRRFQHEVAAARQVRGRHTVPVVDADPDGPRPWLATAYVPGPSLAQAVAAHGPLPAQGVRTLGAGVAEALQAIHAAGVVHRDLKPSNILLAADGPQVIDFGIARAADATPLTRTGMRIGSPQFMAPEQATGHETTPATDVFALGALLYYAATGRAAFGEGPDAAVLFRIANQEPDLADCPDLVRDTVARCLAKDPDERPTPHEVVRALTVDPLEQDWLPPTVAQQLPAYETPPPEPPPVRPRGLWSPARVAAAAAGTAVAIVAAGTVAALAQSGDGSPGRSTGTPSPKAAGGTTAATEPAPSTEPASVGVGPSPGGSGPSGGAYPQATGEPIFLADLTSTGDPMLTGTWSLGGEKFTKSLSVTDRSCGSSSTEFALRGDAALFVADVGIRDDTKDPKMRDMRIAFIVRADLDGDGDLEEIATRAADHAHPARIDADVRGATTIKIITDPQDCILGDKPGQMIWGSPRVFPG